MKLKNLSVAALASMLLILFLPVFYCVIFKGNNMNYNADHKITTLYGNESLLLFAVLGVCVLLALYFLLKRIPYNRYTIAGFTILSLVICIVFYFVNVKYQNVLHFTVVGIVVW